MALVVETGEGVAGANALVSPSECVQYLAEVGELIARLEQDVSGAEFSPPETVTLPGVSGVQAGDLVSLEGSGLTEGNAGGAYVSAVSVNDLTLRWLDGMQAQAGVALEVVAWERSGWWHATRRRLEASIISATEWLSSLAWRGVPVSDVQSTPFPRRELWVDRDGQYYAAGYLVPDDEVPIPVRRACCHLAVEDLGERLHGVQRAADALKSKSVGPISRTFDRPGGANRRPHVDRLLVGLVVRRSAFRALAAG